MEVINETTLEEVKIDENLSAPPMSDPLTGESSIEPLVGSFSGDFSVGNVTTPAQIDTPNILEVTGTGIVSLDTDTAQIQLGIEVQGDTANEVQQEIAQSSSAVVEQLNLLEVEELQTINISLRPLREFDDFGNSTVVGFTGRNTLQFEISTEEAGETIDAAIQAGANLVENISFTASDSELSQARLDAIQLAAQDAQNQANPLLDILGLTPLEIVDIDIISVSNPNPTPFARQLEAVAFDASTPIIGGTQQVVADVALDISYAAL